VELRGNNDAFINSKNYHESQPVGLNQEGTIIMFPLEERRKLWAWRYAYLSFSHCRDCCHFILKEKLTTEHLIYYSLTTAIYVLYARPFVKSYGLEKLSELIVPQNQKALHEFMLDSRHKFYAHVDASTPSLLDGTLAVDVRIKSLKDGGVVVEALEIPARAVGFDKIEVLTDELLKKCRYHSLKIVKRYKSDIPRKPGIYRVNIKDGQDPFTLDLDE
jgi:hypothetical protein